MEVVSFMINKGWDIVLKDQFDAPYFKQLGIFIKKEYQSKTIFPAYKDMFRALRYTDFDDVKVVILGQDPYHGEFEAHGLCFSVKNGVAIPPSLRNVFKELQADVGVTRTTTDLSDWAKQGVLLLNSIMTVVKDQPLSHKNKGWEVFTDRIIERLGSREQPIVFLLWGNYARSKKELITNQKHKIIESAHPSPLSASRGFFGSKPFSKTNVFLESIGSQKIEW